MFTKKDLPKIAEPHEALLYKSSTITIHIKIAVQSLLKNRQINSTLETAEVLNFITFTP